MARSWRDHGAFATSSRMGLVSGEAFLRSVEQLANRDDESNEVRQSSLKIEKRLCLNPGSRV